MDIFSGCQARLGYNLSFVFTCKTIHFYIMKNDKFERNEVRFEFWQKIKNIKINKSNTD